jgi:hypothetical protein
MIDIVAKLLLIVMLAYVIYVSIKLDK